MTTLEDDFAARAAALRAQIKALNSDVRLTRELYDEMLVQQERLITLAFRWRAIACLAIGAVIGQWIGWVVFR
jgi:hypothetical protein